MKIILKNECALKVSDISLAATLCSLNIPLVDIDRGNAQRCAFVFKDTSEVQRLVRAYWSKQLSIEPQALLSALKATKSRLYGERL